MGLIDLAGQTALVTGAAKRVGRSIARALADQGANIIAHYNTSKAEAESLVSELEDRGIRAWALEASLDDRSQTEAMWRQALSCAPRGRVSFLVNNAAIFPSDTLETLAEENLKENLSINTLAPLQLIRLFAAQGRETWGGRTGRAQAPAQTLCAVNLLDARIGGYMRQHVSYALSKRALFSLTRMLALELAPRIRVNAVAPGMILAPERAGGGELDRLAARAPLGRWGDPEDVANAVVFLLRNDYLTGQVIYADGGAFIREDLYG
jgi:pteridine reductase